MTGLGGRRHLLLLALAFATGCGPAFRFRSPEVLPSGDVEVGAGIGAAGRATPTGFGGSEISAWIRGGASDHVEIGGRFYTHSLNAFGGAFELRLSPVRKPVAFSVDLGLLAAGCCGAGDRNRHLAAGAGFDVGFTIGGRIGSDRGPAPYFAPHFEMTWTFPPDNDWPKLLFLPIGVDIPIGTTIVRLRPEFLATLSIYRTVGPELRLGGGVGVAFTGPGAEKLRRSKQAAKPD